MASTNRPWFRFSLRSLLIAMTVLCLLIGFKVKEMRDRRASLAAVDAVGGASKILIEGPEWLRKLIGDEKAFHNVGSVSLSSSRTDYDLILDLDNELRDIIPHLNKFSYFHKLNLASSSVTDKGLSHLKDITHLEELNISGTEISDSGLEILEKIESLQRLNIRNTKVTPNGVAKFQKALPNCKVLWEGK